MKKRIKKSLIIIFFLAIAANGLIAVHAYKFSHFNDSKVSITAKDVIETSFLDKVKLALTGIDLPKPAISFYPEKYTSFEINTNRGTLAGWLLKTDSVKCGTILLFHGYNDQKSSMLTRAYQFLEMGYNVGLIDFMGSGDSSGNQVTIGYHEALDVIDTYNYFRNELQEENLILHGFSMGAIAVMKAYNDKPMNIKALILEAPYSTLETTIASRCDLFGIPKQPSAAIFTFWFGAVNGFNGFSLEPIKYAEKIDIPTLFLLGGNDPYISEKEGLSIYEAIASQRKAISLFKNSAHESYLLNDKEEWLQAITVFLSFGSNKE